MAFTTRTIPAAAASRCNRVAPRVSRRQCAIRCSAVTSPAAVRLEAGLVNGLSMSDGSISHVMDAAGQKLVIVAVSTAWCGPCKMIAPELEKMAVDFSAGAVVCKLDCTTDNSNKKFAMEQGVKALPTFLLFKDGKRVNDMTGAKAANLRKLIEAHM